MLIKQLYKVELWPDEITSEEDGLEEFEEEPNEEKIVEKPIFQFMQCLV